MPSGPETPPPPGPGDVTWDELRRHAEGSWRLTGPNSQGGTTLYRYKGRLFTVAYGDCSSLPGGAEEVVAARPDNTPGFAPLMEDGHAAGCAHEAHWDWDWWAHRIFLLRIERDAVRLYESGDEAWSCALAAFVRAGSPQQGDVLAKLGPAVLDEALRCAARRLE
jgi:hypothetical protein